MISVMRFSGANDQQLSTQISLKVLPKYLIGTFPDGQNLKQIACDEIKSTQPLIMHLGITDVISTLELSWFMHL